MLAASFISNSPKDFESHFGVEKGLMVINKRGSGSGMQSMIDQMQSSPPPTSANSIVDSERSMRQDETHSPTSELSRSSSCASNLLDTSTLSVQERGRSANRVPRNASALFQNHYIAGSVAS